MHLTLLPITLSLFLHQRTTKRQAVPTSTCTSGREGQVHPVPANGDMIWICRSGEWIPFE